MRDAYDFSQCKLVLRHPSLGIITITGEGVGTCTLNMTGDRTTMDVAADGTVMTSKIRDRRGSLGVQLQQTSEANLELLRWYNYLETAHASEWDKITASLTAPNTGEQYGMTRCAFQKLPDRSYGAQGALQTWNIMAADVQQDY